MDNIADQIAALMSCPWNIPDQHVLMLFFFSASVPPRHLLHFAFLVILLHLPSPNVILAWQDHCGDPLTLKFAIECFHTLFFFFWWHKFFSASKNSLIIIITFQQWSPFISTAVQKCIRRYFRDGWFAYYDASSAHHPFSSLNIRYLSFFSLFLEKEKTKKTKKTWFSCFNSPQWTCNWCLHDWLLLCRCFSHKSLSI